MSDVLTAKEELFCKEYLVDLNGAAAARRAGYAKKHARSIAFQCLERPDVREVIRKGMAERAKRVEMTADKVLVDLADIAQTDLTQVVQIKHGQVYVTDTDLLPENVRRCITEISATPAGIRIKFTDRVKALELLGRHLAMFSDNLNLHDKRAKPVEQMTEEEIDAELARLNAKTADGSQEAGTGADQPA
jgi:phage terminase small subunit